MGTSRESDGVKSYSIIIVPSDHSGTRQYKISRALLLVILSLLIVLAATFAVFAATYTSVLLDARRAGALEAENAELRNQVARVQELSQELEAMAGLRAQVVRLLGQGALDEIPVAATEIDGPRFDQRVLGDVEQLQQIFADASRMPFAPRHWPADGAVRREYMAEPSGRLPAHPGLSIDATRDGVARAAGRGQIIDLAFDDEGRHTVVVDHGYGFRTRYGNLDRLLVEQGQVVDRDQPLGEIFARDETRGGDERTSRLIPGALYFQLLVDGSPVDPRGYLDPR